MNGLCFAFVPTAATYGKYDEVMIISRAKFISFQFVTNGIVKTYQFAHFAPDAKQFQENVMWQIVHQCHEVKQ